MRSVPMNVLLLRCSFLLLVFWSQVEAFARTSGIRLVRAGPKDLFHRTAQFRGSSTKESSGSTNPFHSKYSSLARSELQKLAKLNNIKANAKSSEIIVALDQLHGDEESSDAPSKEDDISSFDFEPLKEEYMVDGVSGAELDEVSQILSMQGLSWGDISSMKQAHLDPLKPHRVSIKRGKKLKEITSVATSPEQAFPAVQHLGRTISSRDILVPNAMRKRLKFERDADQRNNNPSGVPNSGDGGEAVASGDSSRGSGRGRVKDRYGDRTRDYEDQDGEEYNSQYRTTTNPYTYTNTNNYNTHTSVPIPTTAHTTPPPRVNLDNTTLKGMLEYLVAKVGYPALHTHTHLRCFIERPNMASSLKVLRQADMAWARGKVEFLYITERKKDLAAV